MDDSVDEIPVNYPFRNARSRRSKFQLRAKKQEAETNPDAEDNDLENETFEARSKSRRRYISRRTEFVEQKSIRLHGKSDLQQGDIAMSDLEISAPTESKHMGIFQFMKFDPMHLEDEKKDDEELEISSEHGVSLAFKEKLKHILHSKALHIVVILLVVIDILLVLFEVLLDLNVIKHAEGNPIREVFHGFSIGILSMFMIEIGLKVYVDHTHFLRHKIELLDALVVIVSWVVDVVLVFIPNVALIAVELLVLLRLWRVVRIINGIILAIKTKADERVHLFKELNHDLQDCLHEAEEDIEKLTKDVEYLTNLLKEHKIDVKENRI